MKNFIKQLFYPKYIVIKGIQIENRAIMFLGAYPCKPKDRKSEIEIHGYYDKTADLLKISFKNLSSTYWKSNIHKRIYTFRQLLKWRRLLPKDNSACLEYKNFKWQKIVN